MWTVNSVRAALPDVEVQIGKNLVRGRVTGRFNEFATVTVDNHGTLHRGNEAWYDWHFTWQTIVNSLNSNKPLVI